MEDDRYVSAWEVARAFGPLPSWRGREARHLAARLARWLGSPRQGSVLHLLNARAHPDDPEAFATGILIRLSRRGPMEMLPQVENRLRGETTDAVRENLLATKSWMLAQLHDFSAAHRALEEAMTLGTPSARTHMMRSRVLEIEDRYAEACTSAREAVCLHPHGAPEILQLQDCLVHLGQDDEAIALLKREHNRGELGAYAERLVNIFSERENAREALHFLDEHDRLHPLLDASGKHWSNRRRADLLYLAGDFDGCLRCCDLVGKGYHHAIAARMRRPGALSCERRRLEVPFVRQHESTCAPATLAALAAYWNRPIDHLSIAEAICYDGTPWHKERSWAEANGFLTAEFRLTHDVLTALIDRGIPFTLTTEAVTSSHLQACIGYDDRQGTALLRDPTERHFGEILLEGLLDDHPVQGPRCMLMIPHEEAERLAGVTLPDAAAYDGLHDVSRALDAHDRASARAALESMPEHHPLTLWAELRLAGYDRNPVLEVRCCDTLCQRFPENAPLRYARLCALQRMRDGAGEKQMLRAELLRGHCDAVYYSEMGDLLARDARQLPMAEYYLRKAVRLRRRTAQVYSSAAFCHWKNRRFEESARHRRVASCLSPSWEPYAAAYAEACRVVARPTDGEDFLRRRVESLGRKNAGPWLTLAQELEAQRRTNEAITVLNEGLTVRPDDGELMMGAGRLLSGWGEQTRAEMLIAQARGKVREADWHKETASLRMFFGKREEAILHWKEVLRLQPHSLEAHRALARLLAEEGDTAQAVAYLEEATARHPHMPALWALRSEWERFLGAEGAIRCLEKTLDLDPDDSWALQELARQKMRHGDGEGALEAGRESLSRAPRSPAAHETLAGIYEDLSRWAEARQSFEEAIRLDIDFTWSSRGLLRVSPDPSLKRAALTFIQGEMTRQVSDGSIVPEYRDMAYPYFDPQDLLEQLRGFCQERPDLWQTWAARGEQARDMDLPDEAMLCAEEMIRRFPLLPRSWMEKAQTHHALGAYEEEVEMLRNAVNLSPAWGWAARQLSDALERLGRYDEAQAVLERNLHHEPLAGASHGYLADLLWKRDRRAEAFAALMRGMQKCPSYNWGWSTLANWALELKRTDEVIHLRDQHHPSRAHLVNWWLLSVDIFTDWGRSEEGLRLIETGLTRHPGAGDLFERKAALLAELGHFEDALKACAEGLQANPDSRTLPGREAFILMQSGKPQEAIRRMSALVEAHPDYLWAIRQLTGWLRDRGRWEEVRDLSRKWIRQDPRSPYAFGHLAEAQKSLSQPSEAAKAFEKAFALDPEYAYAGRNLLSYQIEQGRLDAAAETLQTLEHFVSSADILTDAIELAIARKDRTEAVRRAREVLAHEDTSVSLLNWTRDLFQKAGWVGEWGKMLEAAASKETPPKKPVLEAWIRSLPGWNRLNQGTRRLDALRTNHEDLAAAGWVALLDAIDAKAHARTLKGWIRKHRSWFRSRSDLWSAVGCALTNAEVYKTAAGWFEDWERRGTDIPCAALFDCGVAFQHTRGWQAAGRVRDIALQRFPSHSLAPSLRAMVTLQTALVAGVDAARSLGAEVEVPKLSRHYGHCFALYQSLEAAADGDEATAKARYQRARENLDQGVHDPGLAGLFDDTARKLADLVPWAHGRDTAIKKSWGRYRSNPTAKRLFWWTLVLLIYLVLILLGSL